MDPLFLGGARGAPTDLIAAALDGHPGFSVLPAGWGAHCEPGGLLDLVAGRASMAGFQARLRGEWWPRLAKPASASPSEAGNPSEADNPREAENSRERVGSGQGAPPRRARGGEEELEASLAEFGRAFATDPLGAAAALFARLIAVPDGVVPVCRHPEALPHAQGLARLFPGARFVHVVAAPPGTGAPPARLRALAAWADDLRRIEAGLRDADDGITFALPPERFLALRVEPERPEAALRVLAEFLGIDELALPAAATAPAPAPPSRGAFALAYRLTLARLAREGNHAVELLGGGRGR